ncbi:MAG: excinuclease ABC subunit A [Candidatus Staskawiczbacteria bacterium RIFCSPHIGHO2_12_FULL_38_11]|uniref:UvrABC system protein A n=1 Tax=Candidatus Staskawiczbacteria bacterium RIFCSPHIGHO2_12_FULL_38_11 TaxID=1802209 RepID=A0A1G2I6N6_9BACT|nr:MAG: excinuclease ABC subunit A [Candidatus Staskawiczbacteria bacterium RIFCSPHIGHO2_12_FULL_38_11]
MKNEFIKIRGARVHNLKNIDLDIPKNKLVVITGLSGSGKSSLAFDTLYAEGQRRYVESLSAYARQFLGVMDKPDVDKIEGISPAISIDQRKSVHNPRSTVGTITEIYDYLRLLFARIGKPHCPNCGKLIARQTIDQIVDQVIKLPKNSEITILGPVIRGKKGEHQAIFQEIQRSGFIRVRIDGDIYPIEEALFKNLDKNKKHSIEAVVDRLVLDKDLDRSRLVDSLETALRLGKGIVLVNHKSKILNHKSKNQEDLIFSEHFACEDCGISLPELEPRIFSFNNPYGACPDCTGLGEKLEVDPELVMPNKNLTIAEGAIWPWSKASHKVGRQGYYFWKLSALAQKHKFSLDEPVKNLPPKIIDIILKGDLLARGAQAGGAGFEGVISSLERRYHETDSEWTRAEIEQYMMIKQCETCLGKRLKPEVLAVTVNNKSINDVVELPIENVKHFFQNLLPQLGVGDSKISQPIVKEIVERTQFLVDVGLDYLTLSRKAGTLAGGEEQRIRLATQIGSKLSGVLYILDEPSIGLHARDQHRLIETLLRLRDLGNTVIVVEHDPQTMKAADWLVEIGPGAGKHGGKVVFEGTPKQILKSRTLTGDYLSGRKTVSSIKYQVLSIGQKKSSDTKYSIPNTKYLEIIGAKEHNLKNIDVKFPLGKFICVTGVSGGGKSSLVSDILAKALLKKFYRAKEEPGQHKEILGIENINKVVLVDQSPIGRTPRSNSATYTGAFSYIRDIFTQTKEARVRGYSAGRFSFNVKGGRCESCEGQGVKKVEMYFLPDIYVECEECRGKRYSREVLEILYKEKNIADVLQMTIEEASEFFKSIPGIYDKMKTLKEVGLSYIELGQSATSLSGGEAQRIKLATELSKKGTGNTLYILDEPTTGLHFEDIKKLVSVLRSLVDRGNTVLVIEHNVSLIAVCDWIIDLGPEGGEGGGQVIVEGTPEVVAKNKKSYTSKYLREVFSGKVI